MDDQQQSPKPTLVTPPIPSPKPKTKKVNAPTMLLALVAFAALGLSAFSTKKYLDISTSVAADKSKIEEVSTTQKNDVQPKIKTLEAAATYEDLAVDKDRLQAVFLVGGQVYFGNITEVKKDTIKLENIYYLRTGEYKQDGTVSGSGDVSLAKLGNELHAPEDTMYIERKNLIFWENLKESGQVATAVRDYEKAN